MFSKLLPLKSIVALSLVGVPAFAQTTVAISVNDGRPLAAAASQLEKQVGICINFEDIPYVFAGDLEDETIAVMTEAQRSSHPNAKIIVPKGGPLTIPPVSLLNTDFGGVATVLASLTAAEATAGYPGVYSYSSSNGAFFITPTQMRNSAGNMSAVVPILDTTVTLPSQTRSAGNTLQAILQEVTKTTGTPIEIGQVPNGLMINAMVTLGANDESARSVIERAFSGIATGRLPDGSAVTLLSYQLFFDPQLKYYMFNVHGIQPPKGQPMPVRLNTPANSSNPYMKKTGQ